MSVSSISDIRAGRLGTGEYAVRFTDANPRMNSPQALLEAERCLYCHDAPCITACPTGIDVPSFIRRIADGNVRGAARTILQSNPLGGCAPEFARPKPCANKPACAMPRRAGRWPLAGCKGTRPMR